MNDTCLSAGAGKQQPATLPSRSRRLPLKASVCVCTLAVLYGAAPVQALSGFPDTGQVIFFSGDPNDPDEANEAKFYCDWRFDPGISPSLPACAQHDPGLVALQVGADGLALGGESNVTISSTVSGTITTSTKDVGESFSARVALICETRGDNSGEEDCLRITEDPEDGEGSPSCPTKFANITRNSTQCAIDLAKLQDVFGAAGHIDFTKDRNPDGTLNVNICAPASWICGDSVSLRSGLGNREIQQLGAQVVNTPITCTIGGRTYRYPTPPTSRCP